MKNILACIRSSITVFLVHLVYDLRAMSMRGDPPKPDIREFGEKGARNVANAVWIDQPGYNMDQDKRAKKDGNQRGDVQAAHDLL
jgi:hypothetical protein